MTSTPPSAMTTGPQTERCPISDKAYAICKALSQDVGSDAHWKTLVSLIAALEADQRRLDDLDAIAQRHGVIVTAGDNTLSVVAGSTRSAIDDFIAEMNTTLPV